jgi:hypothetical protein
MAKYKFSKTFEKFGIALVEVIIAGVIVYFTDNGLFLFVIPFLEALRNWLKNRGK